MSTGRQLVGAICSSTSFKWKTIFSNETHFYVVVHVCRYICRAGARKILRRPIKNEWILKDWHCGVTHDLTGDRVIFATMTSAEISEHASEVLLTPIGKFIPPWTMVPTGWSHKSSFLLFRNSLVNWSFLNFLQSAASSFLEVIPFRIFLNAFPSNTCSS